MGNRYNVTLSFYSSTLLFPPVLGMGGGWVARWVYKLRAYASRHNQNFDVE